MAIKAKGSANYGPPCILHVLGESFARCFVGTSV